MVWFCFGKENNSSRMVILKIELELNNLNSNLSRSAVTPVFPGDRNSRVRKYLFYVRIPNNLSVEAGLVRTKVYSQQNPVYKAFHIIGFCNEPTVRH